MSELTQNRLRALALAAAPLVLLVGFVVQPDVSGHRGAMQGAHPSHAEALLGDPDRFALSQLILLVGIALLLMAIVSARQVLRVAGEQRWSFAAVPLVLIGGVLLAGAVGTALARGAIGDTGADMLTIHEEVDEWVTPVFLAGVIGIGLGLLSLAMALYQMQVLGRRQTWVAIVALVVAVVGIFVPETGGGYPFALGMGVAFWLLAYWVWSGSTALAPGESPAAVG